MHFVQYTDIVIIIIIFLAHQHKAAGVNIKKEL